MSSTITILEEPSAVSLERPVSSIPSRLRAEFIAGIVSLVVSPVVLLLLALYYLKRRRARLRKEQRETDAESDEYSIHPYDVAMDNPGPETQSAIVNSKHVLGVEKARGVADADARRMVNADARRSAAAASLDDPEKLAALRRVMQQAGVTLDAMVVGLSRVARIPSYRSTAGARPPQSPPGYER